MPRSILMTWEPGKLRWRKMHRDRVYTVSCREFNAHPSKEASYQAANRWWQSKLAGIGDDPSPHPNAEYLDILTRRLAWAQARGQRDLAQSLRDTIEKVTSDTTGEPDGRVNPFDLPSVVLDIIDGAVWVERLSDEHPDPTPIDKTIGGQVAAWLEIQRSRVRAGKLSADRLDNIKDAIERFESFVGPALPATAIDEGLIERYFYELIGSKLAPSTAETYFKIAKQFTKSLYVKRLIELPRNLDDHQLRFDVQPTAISTFTFEEVRSLVAEATGLLKLHVLLALNCGYVATDISELQDAQVDWRLGTITRKRSRLPPIRTFPLSPTASGPGPSPCWSSTAPVRTPSC